MAEIYSSTPGGGGCYRHCATVCLPLYLGQNAIFQQKKPKKKLAQKKYENGPKVVKNGQNCPQNRRNNWRSPRKSQRIPKISEKWPKTLPLKCENAPKKVKMTKNRQKMAKLIRKIDFLYNNFPQKAISLRKCTQKIYFRLRRKKRPTFFFAPSARYSSPPDWGWDRPFRLLCYFATLLLPKPAPRDELRGHLEGVF